MCARTLKYVFAYSLGCSLESRDLSGLKVIPMSQDSELDSIDTHGIRLRNADVLRTTQASFVLRGVFKRPGVLFGKLFACDPLC